ncbi:unnamed protein product [Protopolystoma xenopodis]|uniref:Uncharacterized protein n=1 Tax=Protopolystoma xenopodis TaxID=117903 RepID=A0A3S5APH6_9PLAT|nr:unnamed protein product [Protopolystoma xenopodis]
MNAKNAFSSDRSAAIYASSETPNRVVWQFGHAPPQPPTWLAVPAFRWRSP